MNKAPAFLAGLAMLALPNASCTFYTACPAGNNNQPATAGTGGTNGGGGTDTAGGDSTAGGESTSGGGSSITGDVPKGVFVNVGSGLAALAKGGGDLTLLSSVPNSPRVIAGVAKSGLWATDDGGETWVPLGTGKGSAVIDNGPTDIIYDPDHPDTFWESGIYGGAVFRTDDAGETFKWLGTLGHCDLVSIDFTDPDRKTLLAGTHEQTDKVSLSKDGGDTWVDIGDKLPRGYNFSTLPLILDAQTFMLGSCGFANAKCGVFRSTDGGDTWSVVSALGPSTAPVRGVDDTLYWTLYDGGVMISEDLGETWTKTSPGPVRSTTQALTLLPDGRVLALGADYPLVTADKGKTWQRVGGKLPFKGENCGTYGLTYSPKLRSIFINRNDCTGKLTDDAVWSVPFDYETE